MMTDPIADMLTRIRNGQRAGKVFVFPHIFAEIMARYMKEHGVSEEDLAHVPPVCYAHANQNPLAQMHKVKVTHADVMKIEGINRYIVDGLPLKTYECSQVSDGYAAAYSTVIFLVLLTYGIWQNRVTRATEGI